MNGSLATDGYERRVLTLREAARELGVCERTLRRYIAAGRLRHHRLPGGHFRIPLDAIQEFWEEHERPNAGAAVRRSRRARDGVEALVASENGSASRKRRPPLDVPVEWEYSLSSERLAEIRARFAIELSEPTGE